MGDDCEAKNVWIKGLLKQMFPAKSKFLYINKISTFLQDFYILCCSFIKAAVYI